MKEEKKINEFDWIIINRNNAPLRFSNGDIVIYGDEDEANEDCLHGDKVVNGIDISDSKILKELSKQINRTKQKSHE